MDDNNNLIGRFQKWAAAPVTQDMDLVSVVLTTILVLSVAFLWTRVLTHVKTPLAG